MGASLIKQGRKTLVGRKVGMTQIFRDDGNWIPVTVLEVGPCTVLRVKSTETEGYASLQVGFVETTKKPRRPQQGLFTHSRVKPKKLIREIPPVDPSQVSRVPLFSEAGGEVEFRGLESGKNLLERKIPRSRLISRVVVSGGDGPGEKEDEAVSEDAAGEAGEARESDDSSPETTESTSAPGSLVIKSSSGKVVKEYPIPAGSSIEVHPGETVADGDLLAYVPVGDEAPGEVAPGHQIDVGLFSGTERVDVRGITKGRGFQGCIKRHGFRSGDKSHGSKNVREPGSTGMHTDPGRVFKGKEMPGRYGTAWRKTKNLQVVEIDRPRNLMLVKGAVPGPSGGYVMIQESL